MKIHFDWDGQYQGVQFTQARPALTEIPLIFPKVSGERELQTTEHALKGHDDAARGVYWTYGVKVQNMSPATVFFDLTGGEVGP